MHGVGAHDVHTWESGSDDIESRLPEGDLIIAVLVGLDERIGEANLRAGRLAAVSHRPVDDDRIELEMSSLRPSHGKVRPLKRVAPVDLQDEIDRYGRETFDRRCAIERDIRFRNHFFAAYGPNDEVQILRLILRLDVISKRHAHVEIYSIDAAPDRHS